MTEHVTRKGNMARYVGSGKSVQTSLREIANKALEKPGHKFRNLYGMIDHELLRLAWRRLNKKASAGIDQVTAQEYGKNLDENLSNLVDRLKRNAYRARLVKRVKIPKGNGKSRDLGIPTLEDRLLQKAVSMILEAIYESIFLKCSFGYRPGKNAKMAVKEFRDALNFGVYQYVVEADIKGFFDHLNHEWLIRMLEERINDQKLIRLVKKWLRAGILEADKMVINPLTGTPQGGIVSPILANVYLHYVLDLWIDKVFLRDVIGEVKYVRYADDFVCAFTSVRDAERFRNQLPERLGKFGLEVAEDKTRVVRFSRSGGGQNGRIDFLGFELFWGKSRTGRPHVRRRTSRKKLRGSVKATGEWIKKNRSLKEQILISRLNRKLVGYYEFYGVIGNIWSLASYFYQTTHLLFKWLNRRSQKKSMTWDKFARRIGRRLIRPYISEQRSQQQKLPGLWC